MLLMVCFTSLWDLVPRSIRFAKMLRSKKTRNFLAGFLL